MLLLGAWQGERISLLAVTQHPPSALETELAASILMAASTLRIITELMFSPPQFHLLPGAACSSSWLLPTTSTIRTPAGHLIVSITEAQLVRAESRCGLTYGFRPKGVPIGRCLVSKITR